MSNSQNEKTLNIRLSGSAKEFGQALAIFAPVCILGACGEKSVARGVQGGLDGILHDADDESDAHHLHCHVRGDTENRARHGNQKQRAASNSRRAAGGN